MQDRISQHPGRVKLTPVPGQTNTYDMVRADDAVQAGTPLSKGNLLADPTASAFGLGVDAVPNDVFSLLSALYHTGSNQYNFIGGKEGYLQPLEVENANYSVASKKFIYKITYSTEIERAGTYIKFVNPQYITVSNVNFNSNSAEAQKIIDILTNKKYYWGSKTGVNDYPETYPYAYKADKNTTHQAVGYNLNLNNLSLVRSPGSDKGIEKDGNYYNATTSTPPVMPSVLAGKVGDKARAEIITRVGDGQPNCTVHFDICPYVVFMCNGATFDPNYTLVRSTGNAKIATDGIAWDVNSITLHGVNQNFNASSKSYVIIAFGI